MLLIVPRGIEILLLFELVTLLNSFNRTKRYWNLFPFHHTQFDNVLLIVPRGIEMFTTLITKRVNRTFNRTKRYWNICFPDWFSELVFPFNRTKRYWNTASCDMLAAPSQLLIVPRGIEIRVVGMVGDFIGDF